MRQLILALFLTGCGLTSARGGSASNETDLTQTLTQIEQAQLHQANVGNVMAGMEIERRLVDHLNSIELLLTEIRYQMCLRR